MALKREVSSHRNVGAREIQEAGSVLGPGRSIREWHLDQT